MPQLIKKIEGQIFNETIGTTQLLQSITGQVQQEDYVDLNGFIAYLQNLSKTQDTYLLINPVNFGLKSKNRRVEIQISY